MQIRPADLALRVHRFVRHLHILTRYRRTIQPGGIELKGNMYISKRIIFHLINVQAQDLNFLPPSYIHTG